MYTVIELQGHQWIVKKGDVIEVDNIGLEEGQTLTTDKILLSFDEEGKDSNIGKPYLKGEVKLSVKENFRGEKMYIRKFKNKTRSDRNSKGKGFRACKSLLVVEEISL